MRETPKLGNLPLLSVWTDADGGCVVALSNAGQGVPCRPEFERLAGLLAPRGLRLRGITRSNAAAAPTGLREIGHAPWRGGDLTDEVARVLDAAQVESPARDR